MDLRGKSFEWIAAMPLLALAVVGCTTPGTGQTTAINREREKDAVERANRRLEMDAAGTPGTPVATGERIARSQAPGPIIPVASVKSTSIPETRPELQTRIVAIVGNTYPIYEREIREAVAERAPEFYRLRGADRTAKEKQIAVETLKRLIERELIIEELMTKIAKAKNDKAKEEIQKMATEEADKRIKEARKNGKIDSEEEFSKILESQGVSLAGWRRKFERDALKRIYLRELLKPKMDMISLGDIREYYQQNADKFRVEDSVKWNDMFISCSKFETRAEALRYAEVLLAHVKAGKDFAGLVKQYDHGDSKYRNGMGAGEKKDDIRPPECAEAVFALKPGEAKIVEMENGFHIVKVADRVYAGTQPFTEKIQADIREQLTSAQGEREYQRIADALWRKSQPQILIEP